MIILNNNCVQIKVKQFPDKGGGGGVGAGGYVTELKVPIVTGYNHFKLSSYDNIVKFISFYHL